MELVLDVSPTTTENGKGSPWLEPKTRNIPALSQDGQRVLALDMHEPGFGPYAFFDAIVVNLTSLHLEHRLPIAIPEDIRNDRTLDETSARARAQQATAALAQEQWVACTVEKRVEDSVPGIFSTQNHTLTLAVDRSNTSIVFHPVTLVIDSGTQHEERIALTCKIPPRRNLCTDVPLQTEDPIVGSDEDSVFSLNYLAVCPKHLILRFSYVGAANCLQNPSLPAVVSSSSK